MYVYIYIYIYRHTHGYSVTVVSSLDILTVTARAVRSGAGGAAPAPPAARPLAPTAGPPACRGSGRRTASSRSFLLLFLFNACVFIMFVFLFILTASSRSEHEPPAAGRGSDKGGGPGMKSPGFASRVRGRAPGGPPTLAVPRRGVAVRVRRPDLVAALPLPRHTQLRRREPGRGAEYLFSCGSAHGTIEHQTASPTLRQHGSGGGRFMYGFYYHVNNPRFNKSQNINDSSAANVVVDFLSSDYF